jgi:hypothetical protein
MNKWQVVLVGAIAFGGALAVAASALPRGSAGSEPSVKGEPAIDTSEIFRRLKSADVAERDAAFLELTRLHEDVTARLLEIASTPKPQYLMDDSRQLAVELLTKFYSPDAIPILVEHVDYSQPGFPRALPLERSPGPALDAGCALALQRFGQLSTAAILEHLWKTPPEDISEEANKLYAWLFIKAYGGPFGSIAGGPKEAIAVIERARDRAFNDRAKGNCQRLLDKVKALTKDWPGVKP